MHRLCTPVHVVCLGQNPMKFIFLESAQHFSSFETILSKIGDICSKKNIFHPRVPTLVLELNKISNLSERGLFLKNEWGTNKIKVAYICLRNPHVSGHDWNPFFLIITHPYQWGLETFIKLMKIIQFNQRNFPKLYNHSFNCFNLCQTLLISYLLPCLPFYWA